MRARDLDSKAPDPYRHVVEEVRAVLHRAVDECVGLMLGVRHETDDATRAESRKPPRSPRAPVAPVEASDTDRAFARRVMKSAGWPTRKP